MESKAKILVIDDEQDLREILEFNLASQGFAVDTATSAEAALNMPLEQYHLILLDVMMAGMSGYEMAEILRKERDINIPIIFLTAKVAEDDMLTGFNLGADDYICKPFSIKEVVVRIKAVLKRAYAGNEQAVVRFLCFDDLKINTETKIVHIDDSEVKLTRKEFDILVLLLANKGKFITRQEILTRIWSNDVIVTDRNVDVNIARMRKKIGKYGQNIINRTGYGYSFNE